MQTFYDLANKIYENVLTIISQIAEAFNTSIRDFVDIDLNFENKWLEDIMQNVLDTILNIFPNITLFELTLGTSLSLFLVFTFIRWILLR